MPNFVTSFFAASSVLERSTSPRTSFSEAGLHLLCLIDQPHLLFLQLLGRAPGGNANPDFPREYQEQTEPEQEHGPKIVISRRSLMPGRLDVRLLVHSYGAGNAAAGVAEGLYPLASSSCRIFSSVCAAAAISRSRLVPICWLTAPLLMIACWACTASWSLRFWRAKTIVTKLRQRQATPIVMRRTNCQRFIGLTDSRAGQRALIENQLPQREQREHPAGTSFLRPVGIIAR